MLTYQQIQLFEQHLSTHEMLTLGYEQAADLFALAKRGLAASNPPDARQKDLKFPRNPHLLTLEIGENR